MSANTRPPARRNPSSAWGRLKPAQIDPLEVYGLPSKGETRLSDPKTQEAYFERIVARYMKFCANCANTETLEAAFASLTLNAPSPPQLQQHQQAPTTNPPPLASATTATAATDLPLILLAMRKLRESLISTNRLDAFARRAYILTIHVLLLSSHPEASAALVHLLQKIHPRTPLSGPELQEFAGYLVLDLACRQHDFQGAYKAARKYGVRDKRVRDVVKALVRGDYVLFWRVRGAVDGYQRCLVRWAEEGVRVHALKCLGRAYLGADKRFVERAAGGEWEDLVRSGVGWVLEENGTVTIRRPKVR